VSDTINDTLVTLRLAVKELQDRIERLETGLDDLWSFAGHDHPYKPEPRYGAPL